MKFLLSLFLAVVVGVACAESRNLDAKDLQGRWQSDFPTTFGEIDELEFYPDGHVRFLRTFKDQTKQEFSASSASRVTDLEIVKFSNNGALRYKLVLSGWLTGRTKKLFGTMFMYGKRPANPS